MLPGKVCLWHRKTFCLTTVMHAGANVQKGKSLDSPLHAAAEKDCTDVVKLLLDFGADINARNTEFQRPVDVAPPSSLTEGFLLLYEGMRTSANFLCRTFPPCARIQICVFSPFIWVCSTAFSVTMFPNKSAFLEVINAVSHSSHFQFYSYSTTAQSAVSSVHQKLCWPGQTSPAGPSTPANQAQELPAVSLKDGKLEIRAYL